MTPPVAVYFSTRVWIEVIQTEEDRKELIDSIGHQDSLEVTPLPFTVVFERSTRTLFAVLRNLQ